ncbi:MAG: alpha/beta fold hydrolase [Desulfobacteraceae bacterium]|nr:alpha/beta fold hydrolase [Desulfobacteraceae bacterium]
MSYYKTQDGCRLYYELLGDGPAKPLITFVNGTLQTTVYWKLVSNGFTGRFRILLYDCRGQGESDIGQLPLSLKLHACDLKDLLFDLDVNESIVVGLSHGARTALTLADQAPELISKMVLCSISTSSNFRAKMIVRSWYEILQRHRLDAMVWAALPFVFGTRFLKKNEKQLDRIVKTIVRRNKTDALRLHLEAMQKYTPLSSNLYPMPFPVLVLTGEDDPLVTVQGAQQVADITGGRHVEFKNMGHSLAAEDPGQFVQIVYEFING